MYDAFDLSKMPQSDPDVATVKKLRDERALEKK